MASAKIPDMFLRGLKRKAATLAEITANCPPAAKEMASANGKIDGKPVVESENKVPKYDNDKNKPMDVLACEQENASTPPTTVSTNSNAAGDLFSLLTDEGWKNLLKGEFEKKYMKEVQSFLQKQHEKKVQVFPPRDEIFSAFNLTPLENVKVVIIGQDPYHNDGQAHGLSFSVKKGVKPPPSLKNMYKELIVDIPGFVAPDHGYLEGWAKQGVFMLNASLTVEAHKANSHAKIGWQTFTDQVIKLISRESPKCVFVLWGGFAHKKESLIDGKKHAVVKSAHPSPLSARHWFGCRCFSKTNGKLEEFGMNPIDWAHLP